MSAKRKASTTTRQTKRSKVKDDPVNVQFIKEGRTERNEVVTERKILLKLAPGDTLTNVFIEEKQRLDNIGIKFTNDTSLPYGDVWFMDVTEENEEPGLLICLERKTQNDLQSSVQHDQRWALQRDRMLRSKAMVLLVIEGTDSNHPLTPSIIRSCLIKFGIFHLRTANVDETFVRVCEIVKDLRKGTDLKTFRGPVLKYGPKEQQAEMALASCLAMVHMVTKNLGMAIQEKYKTMRNLMKAYEECETERDRELMFANFTYRVLPDATTVVDPRAPMPDIMTVPVNTSIRIYNFFCHPEKLQPTAVEKEQED